MDNRSSRREQLEKERCETTANTLGKANKEYNQLEERDEIIRHLKDIINSQRDELIELYRRIYAQDSPDRFNR